MHMAKAILCVIESSDGRPIKFILTYGSEFRVRILESHKIEGTSQVP